MKLHDLHPKIDPDYNEPRQILDALNDAGEDMSYSNYHNRMFEYARIIIMAYCKEKGVRIGPTKAAREKRQNKRHEVIMGHLNSDDPRRRKIGMKMMKLKI